MTAEIQILDDLMNKVCFLHSPLFNGVFASKSVIDRQSFLLAVNGDRAASQKGAVLIRLRLDLKLVLLKAHRIVYRRTLWLGR